ncbi:PREDICTED: snurportin-1-like, partial [Priapulus caudatus]|uniref:Snurportin-1 n=1 Tax=Priapulus caudatus TaxID=37621 RepID=A0ABM1ELH3_PRICU
MEELTEGLAASFSISQQENSTAAEHPRFAQYKAKLGASGQDERRSRQLELQKKNRSSVVNHLRRLAGSDSFAQQEQIDDEEDAANDGEEMEVDVKSKKRAPYYRNKLMLSEWLVDVPADLSEEWILVPCPVGRRNLVVAAKGVTSSYTKAGHLLSKFSSHLPGGYRGHAKRSAEYTLLDCILSEAERKYYVLDVMSWNGHPVVDSETDFRFFWLKSKLDEIPKLAEYSKLNPLKFEGLPTYQCTPDGVAAALEANFPFQVDGFLFYHKRTHYTFGPTPLVGWLKPYMMEELLGVAVPEKHRAGMPPHYANLRQHIADWERESREARKTRKHRGGGCDNRGGGGDNRLAATTGPQAAIARGDGRCAHDAVTRGHGAHDAVTRGHGALDARDTGTRSHDGRNTGHGAHSTPYVTLGTRALDARDQGAQCPRHCPRRRDTGTQCPRRRMTLAEPVPRCRHSDHDAVTRGHSVHDAVTRGHSAHDAVAREHGAHDAVINDPGLTSELQRRCRVLFIDASTQLGA